MRPPGIEQTYEIYLGLFTADGGAGIESLLKEAGTHRVHPLMQRVLELQRQGAKSVAELAALVGRWDAFRREMLSFMSNYDALLCPVCSFAGMAHGSTYDRLSCFSYTMTSNLTGWPAAVVRGGATEKGLPMGVQIVARPRPAAESRRAEEEHEQDGGEPWVALVEAEERVELVGTGSALNHADHAECADGGEAVGKDVVKNRRLVAYEGLHNGINSRHLPLRKRKGVGMRQRAHSQQNVARVGDCRVSEEAADAGIPKRGQVLTTMEEQRIQKHDLN